MLLLLAPAKSMRDHELIDISVIYALPNEQIIVKMRLASGTTVAEAVRESGLVRRFAHIVEAPCAIFGQFVEPSRRLRSGDRVEILRDLLMDPKEARRRAASATRSGAKNRH
jgi:uncharacterized protein